MHKLLLITVCWLLAGNHSFAQETDTVPLIYPKNEWFIKFSPLALFEIDGGIGFSGEYVMPKSKLGIQLELQPIFFSLYQNDGNGIEEPDRVDFSGMPLGIKIRPEVRYYLDGLPSKPYHTHVVKKADGTILRRSKKSRTYAAFDLLLKKVWTQRLGNVLINNGGVQQGYWQRATYTDIKQILGADLRLGAIVPFSNSNNWSVEFYAGIGIRFKKFSYKNLPVGASEPNRSTIGIPTDITNEAGVWHSAMSLPIGIKLVRKL